MYKVMIIDDERSIRNLLKNIIKLEELNVEIVGEAESGIEAINTIDSIRPDIAFVDIKMPFMDGIEFSMLAKKKYPGLSIIILTALSEFEYARKCIGIGVCEYLLKPIVRKEIREVLQRIIKEMDSGKYKNEVKVEAVSKCNSLKNNSIDKIKEYIEENHIKPDLDLTTIAQQFGFNSSYLSRLFKSETGVNIIDYITECRINKAIDYAKKGTLMYITAKMVGIPDPNYFGKCFKKYTNHNYSEYLKSNKNEKNGFYG